MNSNIHSEGHVGGTRLPSMWERRCSRPWFSGSRALQVVPQRAPHCDRVPVGAAELCGTCVSGVKKGTKGHDRPQESNSVHGRP